MDEGYAATIYQRERVIMTPVPQNGAVPGLAYCYGRVSTTEQADHGFSLPAQLEKCLALAYQEGRCIPVERRFAEDVTGMTLERPELTRLRTLAAQEHPEALYVSNPGRLARSLRDLLTVQQELQTLGITLRIAEMPFLVLDDSPFSMFIFQNFGAFSQLDRGLIRERLMTGILNSVRAGNPCNCPVLGYRYVKQPRGGAWEIVAEEAAAVQEAFHHYNSGDSASAVARWLTTTGIRPHRSVRRVRLDEPYHWPVPTVLSLLRNATYKGTWHFRKTVKSPGYAHAKPSERTYLPRPEDDWMPVPVPAIVAPEVWDQAQDHLAHRRPARGTQKHAHLFRDRRLQCGLCGTPMYGILDTSKWKRELASRPSVRRQYRAWHAYQCTHTANGKVWRKHKTTAWRLEDLAWEALAASLLDPGGLELAIKAYIATQRTRPPDAEAETATLRTALQRTTEELSRWDRLYRQDRNEAGLERREWLAERKQLAARKKQLEAQVQRAEPTPGADGFDAPTVLKALAPGLQALATADEIPAKQRVLEALDVRAVWSPDRLELTARLPVHGHQIPVRLPDVPLPLPGRRGTAKAALQAASAATLETVERFLAVHCVRSPGAEVRSATLYRAYVAWCQTLNVKPLHTNVLGIYLTACGVGRRDTRGHCVRTGLRLRDRVQQIDDESE
jgi:site-specific DNA recombinase